MRFGYIVDKIIDKRLDKKLNKSINIDRTNMHMIWKSATRNYPIKTIININIKNNTNSLFL